MNYNTITLSNGLRVIHLPSDSPVVYCGIGIGAGSRHESAAEQGLAHFCEHASFKGTTRRAARHILKSLESVGGDLNAFTNKEATFYYAAVMADHTRQAVSVLCDIVFSSVYPQAELEKEAEVVCDEIESYNDSPAELIYDEFEDMLFSPHPLGHNILGDAQRVRTFGHDEASAFTARHYLTTNAVFYAYGRIGFDTLVRHITAATAHIDASRTAPTPTPGAMADAATCAALDQWQPETRIVKRATHQAHVMTGCRAYSAHDPRHLSLYLLNNMLGGPGMTSRLNMALRERLGLVYTVESTMAAYSDTGAWYTYFGCDAHDVRHCLRLVRHEQDRLMQKALTTAQLNAAKRQIKGQIAIACDSREAFAIDFAKNYLHYGRLKDVGQLMARIDALTPDDLLTVARETFARERQATLIYMPEA